MIRVAALLLGLLPTLVSAYPTPYLDAGPTWLNAPLAQCGGYRVPGGRVASMQFYGGVSASGPITIDGTRIEAADTGTSDWIELGPHGALCIAGATGGAWAGPTTWAPAEGMVVLIDRPGGLNAIHVWGDVIVPQTGLIWITGTPRRLPALLISADSHTGTWQPATLPPGTRLEHDPPGLPPGLYLWSD